VGVNLSNVGIANIRELSESGITGRKVALCRERESTRQSTGYTVKGLMFYENSVKESVNHSPNGQQQPARNQ